MKGYFSLPAEAAGIKDGWLFTGDLGTYVMPCEVYLLYSLKFSRVKISEDICQAFKFLSLKFLVPHRHLLKLL